MLSVSTTRHAALENQNRHFDKDEFRALAVTCQDWKEERGSVSALQAIELLKTHAGALEFVELPLKPKVANLGHPRF